MNNTLERHKFFPFIAWATVIGFAFFVVQLTLHVSDQIATLGEYTASLEQSL